jgi:hypothetical protein
MFVFTLPEVYDVSGSCNARNYRKKKRSKIIPYPERLNDKKMGSILKTDNNSFSIAVPPLIESQNGSFKYQQNFMISLNNNYTNFIKLLYFFLIIY